MSFASWTRGEAQISTDPSLVDVDAVHAFLARSYWAGGVTRDVVERSIANSICFGLYVAGRQVGFARAITDRATTCYVADVFVLDEHRGKGYGLWIMQCMREHPDLQALRVWRLATRDAHGLYEKVGFRPLAHPDRLMEIIDPAVYAGERSGD